MFATHRRTGYADTAEQCKTPQEHRESSFACKTVTWISVHGMGGSVARMTSSCEANVTGLQSGLEGAQESDEAAHNQRDTEQG